LREIQISVRQGQVGLVGTVPTYHLKQLAQAVVLGVEGVAAVENGLSVPPEAGPEAPEPDLPA
jgi:osmotically-inducible protein OsmY